MNDLKKRTLVFLVKRNQGTIDKICLALKKRGFGMGNWNGVGGKLEAGETVEQAARREAKEEINVDVNDLNKVAELTFLFPEQPEFDMIVHTYVCESWTGEPSESEEMKPEWYKVADIPYDHMWADDPFWLPQVLDGKFVKAMFSFNKQNELLDQAVTNMDSPDFSS